jgi:hypothetical protein
MDKTQAHRNSHRATPVTARRRLRVAIGGVEHETNTYATEYTGLTTRRDFSEVHVREMFTQCTVVNAFSTDQCEVPAAHPVGVGPMR